MRVATRLMELGILTAEQGMQLFHTGRFPQAEELEGAQSKFVVQRERGYFNPIAVSYTHLTLPTTPYV